MQFERRGDHRRNEKLEALLGEINTLLGSVEEQAIQEYERNRHPLLLLVGNPRSGTTLFMQWLASLGCFSYPTNLLSRFYGAPYIGAKIQLMLTKHDFNNEIFDFNPQVPFASRLGKTKGALAPNEFWYFWRRFFPYGDIQYLDEDGLGKVDSIGFLRELGAIEAAFEQPLAMKGHIINWNIPFIDQLLDKVLFVDIRRNPFYVIQSLLHARLDYYGDLCAWHSYKPPEYSFLKDFDPYEQVAGQVYYIKEAVDKGFRSIDENRKLIIDYDKFCNSPEKEFHEIFNKLKAQGYNNKFEYTGEKKFKPAQKVKLSADEVDRVIRAYKKFSGEDIAP